MMKIGLIGIVGKELESDFWGTLERVAAIGYQGLELGGPTLAKAGQPAAEVCARLDALGLPAIAYHTTKYAFAEKGREILDQASELGCPFLVLSWGPVESRAQLLADADLYNSIGERCQARGLQLTYHNHDHEFVRFGADTAFDILMDNTEPELLHAHIDVAWVTFGGAKPADLIRKHGGRCPALHVKDLVRLEPGCESAKGDRKQARFTEVGTGIVDLAGVAAAAKVAGVEWLTVEHDRPRDLPPFESIEASYANLKRAIA